MPKERAAVELPAMVGTMEWMSPEIMLNWRVEKGLIERDRGCAYVESADTFAVAVVVWECATGQMPYQALRDEKGEELHPVDLANHLKAQVPQGLKRRNGLGECGSLAARRVAKSLPRPSGGSRVSSWRKASRPSALRRQRSGPARLLPGRGLPQGRATRRPDFPDSCQDN